MRHHHDFELVIIKGRPAIRGHCDLSAVREIEAWLATFDARPLEVDLSGVTFFDSMALRALLNARGRNPDLRVVNPSNAVRRVLEITGTSNYLIDDTDNPMTSAALKLGTTATVDSLGAGSGPT